ncbi:MAG TPA: DnaB-like helicase N-terminal domain-containing protein, partial [Dehalococcoidia bacterium]|nr:DnaB-like helicase N-terminal domain-containing protein [Dehalococcoidia bacterium]
MVIEKLPPHDTEAEEAVLASLLVDPEAVARVAGTLRPNDFFTQRNGWVYQACLALWERNEAVNELTVAHELARAGQLEEAGGLTYLSRIIAELPTPVGVEHYARIVERDALYRRLIGISGQIAQM